jgi:hypothetical protein
VSGGVVSSACDDDGGGSQRDVRAARKRGCERRGRAPLSWTNEREEGSGFPSAILASEASNQKLREQL